MKKILIFCLSFLLSPLSILAKNCNDDCFSSSKSNNNDCSSCDVSSCRACDFDCNSSDNDCDTNNFNCSTCCLTSIRTAVHFRSQGANTARELVGWQWEINKPYMCENYSSIYLAYEYQRSFRPGRLANAIFGSSTLRFSGSLVENRDPKTELLADNFGLPRTFRGSVTFCPRIENHIVDLGYYMGLDCWLQGAYIRLHAPIVHTRWNLRGRESVETTTDTLDACLVDSTSGNPTTAASSIEQALSGTFLFGDMQTPWSSGRIDFCTRTRTGLADIDLILGYNWQNDDCYHVGGYIQLVFPTGPKNRNRFLFEPTVGNWRHFELGVGISAHTVLWSCADQNLSVFFEGNITHLFKNRQCRLFDFCQNGPFSRYLLLKEFEQNGTTITYNGNLISATVFNTREVDVKINVKGDASIKFAYRWCNWGVDIGYNIYGHSQEHISLRDGCCDLDSRKFAIAGTESVCCFDYPVINVGESAVPTIFPNGTTNFPANSFRCSDNANCSIGECVPYTVTRRINSASQPGATAFKGGIEHTIVPSGCTVSLAPGQQVTNPSGQPVSTLVADGFRLCNPNNTTRFVSVGDLNLRSGEALSVLTHKVFVHFNYTWFDECGWNPHIGIGAEVEFDGSRHNDQVCKNSGLNQWGAWLKGGVSF